MDGEAGLELLQVAACQPDSALRAKGRGDHEVGALEADGVMARAEEEALDDRPSFM